MTQLAKEPVVAALAAEFTAIDNFLSDLEPREWANMTPCPGWDVRANVAHIIGTESLLAGVGEPDMAIDPESAPHVRNEIGFSNERWVRSLAGVPIDDVMARFRAITSQRLQSLRTMGPDE